MQSAPACDPVHFLPTGFPELNDALGGGLPAGRIVEVFGHKETWKTGLALRATCAVARRRGAVTYMNVDGRVDPARGTVGDRLTATALDHGGDLRKVAVSPSNAFEVVFERVEALAREGATSLIVVDSVNGLAPLFGELPTWWERQTELTRVEGAMLAALRKICGTAHRTGTTVLFLRTTGGVDMGPVAREALGPLGNALKMYASVRVELSRPRRGIARARVVKNKCGPVFAVAELPVDGVEPEPVDADD